MAAPRVESVDSPFDGEDEGQVVEAVQTVDGEVLRQRAWFRGPHEQEAGSQPAAVCGGEIVPELTLDGCVQAGVVAPQGKENEELKEERKVAVGEGQGDLRRERKEVETARGNNRGEDETHRSIAQQAHRESRWGRTLFSTRRHGGRWDGLCGHPWRASGGGGVRRVSTRRSRA